MCEDEAGGVPTPRRPTRRALLTSLPTSLATLASFQAQPSVELAPGLAVHPRSTWATTALPDVADLPREQPGDVRVLLVHHSATTNAYDATEVAATIRGFHDLHTSPEKGWPDVAYNFFVDRFGGTWEGRSGSLAGPVIADATGGNQGYSQLVCLIGDFQTEAPTAAALDSLTSMLAWLAGRYDVDPSPGTTASFTSRGSNKWAKGTTVTTNTIAGHRDMSATVCPGDAAYRLVVGSLPADVTARAALLRGVTPTTTTTAAPPTTTPPTTTVEPTDPTTAATSTTGRSDVDVASGREATGEAGGDGSKVGGAIAVGGGITLLGACALILRSRRIDRVARGR